MKEFTLEFDVPCSVRQQYEFLFSEASFKRDYHLARGDKEVTVSEWKNNKREIVFLSKFDAPALVRRAIGKETTLVREVQTLQSVADDVAIVTAETFFTDVPMADQYSTSCEWKMTRTDTGSHCRIHVQVMFKRNIFGITSGIEKMMYDKGFIAFRDFVDMAKTRVRSSLDALAAAPSPQPAAPVAVEGSSVVVVSPAAAETPAAVAAPSPRVPVYAPLSYSGPLVVAQPQPQPRAVSAAAAAGAAGYDDEFFDALPDFDSAPRAGFLPSLSLPLPPSVLQPQPQPQLAPQDSGVTLLQRAQAAEAAVAQMSRAMADVVDRLERATAQLSAFAAAAEQQVQRLRPAAATYGATGLAVAVAAPREGVLQSAVRTVVRYVSYSPVTRGLALLAALVAWPMLSRVLVRASIRLLHRWQRALG